MLHAIASQIGHTERHGADISGTVLGYLAAGELAPIGDSVPSWGAALLAWAAQQSGLAAPANPGEPSSWLAWGSPLAYPQAGAVVVLTGGGRPGFLCGVAARVQAAKVYVIGAFDGVVQTRAFPIEQVISARSHGAMASAPIVEQPSIPAFQPAPPVARLPAPEPQPTQQSVPQHSGEITAAHLQHVLSLVQDGFADLESQIETVRRHAVGGVALMEAK